MARRGKGGRVKGWKGGRGRKERWSPLHPSTLPPLHPSFKSCPDCGGTKFDEGTVALYNSISYLVFSSEKHRFVTLGNSLKARVCLGCGRMELFAPPKAFKKKPSNPAGGRGK